MAKQYIIPIEDMQIETGLSETKLRTLVNNNIIFVAQKEPVLLFFSKDIEKIKFVKQLFEMGYNIDDIKRIVKDIGIPSEKQKTDPKDKLYKIGDFCKKFNLNSRQIKYWESIGLFFPAVRTSGGVRLYNEKLLIHIKFIQNLQALGFSLNEIKNIINKNDIKKIEERINHYNEIIREIRPILKNMKKLR